MSDDVSTLIGKARDQYPNGYMRRAAMYCEMAVGNLAGAHFEREHMWSDEERQAIGDCAEAIRAIINRFYKPFIDQAEAA